MSDPILIYSWFDTACPNAVRMVQTYGNDGVTPEDADWTADQLLARPAGGRVLLFNGGCDLITNDPRDRLPGGKMSLWYPNGIAEQSRAWLDVLTRLRDVHGITLDELVLDGEGGPSVWHPHFDDKAITADPRYAEAQRVYGFPDEPWQDPVAFNAAASRVATASSSFFGQIVQTVHGCGWSNFGASPIAKADAELVPDPNGWPQHSDPDFAYFYSPAWYGTTGNLRKAAKSQWGKKAGDYVAGWDSPEGRPLTSYERVTWCLNSLPAAYRADPTARFRVWTTSPASTGPVITLAHLIELRLHALIAGNGKLLHWAGPPRGEIWPTGLTPEQYAEDDAVSTVACRRFLALAGGVKWVRLVGLETLRKDTDYYVATAAEFPDGMIRGRVTWADKAVVGNTYSVAVAKGVKIRLTRGDESGQSFKVKAA